MNQHAQMPAAYLAGQIIGALILIVVLLGPTTFFLIALIKAIRTRRTGWIAAAIVSGLPVVLVFVVLFVALIVGVLKGAGFMKAPLASRSNAAETLQSASMNPFYGNALSYTISIPWANYWIVSSTTYPYDYLFQYKYASLCVGVIAEGIGEGSTEAACDVSQQNLGNRFVHSKFSTTSTVDIGGLKWITYDAFEKSATGGDVDYRFYIYSDNARTIKIIGFTGPLLFDSFTPVIDRIAKTFRFTK